MLSAERLDAIDDEVVARYDPEMDEDLPVPSLAELQAYSREQDDPVRVIKVREDGRLVGLSVCYMETRKVHGFRIKVYSLLGYGLYDYLRIWHQSEEVFNRLMKEIRRDAAGQGADMVFFDYFLPAEGHRYPPRNLRPMRAGLFDPALEPDGWDAITSKRTIRKMRARLAKQNDYQVTHRTGAVSDDDLETMARLHQERWSLDRMTSLFDHDLRPRQLNAHPENKLFTKITLNGEVFACHYGMVYGGTLVFHTPVVNIKFLEHSPLNLLLYETASWCKDNCMRLLDLGVGDETYKDRFSNSHRDYSEFYMPVSRRGRMAATAWGLVDPPAIRERLVGAKRKAFDLRIKVMAHVNKVACYEMTGGGPAPVTEAEYIEAGTFGDFVDLCRRFQFPVTRLFQERFREGASFVALHHDEQIVTHGWATRNERFWVAERDRIIDNSGAAMLFDFETPPAHRRRGHYTTLLRRLVSRYEGEPLRIFALTGNTPSNKAIVKAGFQPCELWPRWTPRAEEPASDEV